MLITMNRVITGEITWMIEQKDWWLKVKDFSLLYKTFRKLQNKN